VTETENPDPLLIKTPEIGYIHMYNKKFVGIKKLDEVLSKLVVPLK
jgi:hypothetical protein